MNENKEEVTININTEDNIEPFQEVKEEQPKVEEKKEEKKSPLLKIIIPNLFNYRFNIILCITWFV